MSYHDLYIETQTIKRTSIFNLPFRVRVTCCRVAGWEAWALKEGNMPEELLGGEYGYDAETGEGQWLVLDVYGYIICNSKPPDPTDGR